MKVLLFVTVLMQTLFNIHLLYAIDALERHRDSQGKQIERQGVALYMLYDNQVSGKEAMGQMFELILTNHYPGNTT